jgi:ABC-2 type transport system permease protein
MLAFLFALWKSSLLSAIEYRVAFLTQVLGMMLNNAMYFLFWMIFFDRFKEVGGWGLRDMLLLFGVVAVSFGLGVYLFGNAVQLSAVIVQGRLDYYLALPKPVLLHALASRSTTSGLGDFTYGLISFAIAGQFSLDTILRFMVAVILATTIFISFMVLINSLAFWIGNASNMISQIFNAIITFSLYPITLFDGTAKLLLFTVIPAALIGALPAEFVRTFSWGGLIQLLVGAVAFFTLSIAIFYRGLRRYESGSAILTQI